MSSLYGSRLLRAGGRSTLIQQRLAAAPRSNFTTATAPRVPAIHQSLLQSQVARLCKTSNRLPKRVSTSHVAKRAFSKTPAATAEAAGGASKPTPAPRSNVHEMNDTDPMVNPFLGVSSQRFPDEVSTILRRSIDDNKVEIKPDGILYLPEILYRAILFQAFGPGGWGMVPRGPPQIGAKVVTREWALFAEGRFVAQSIGEGTYFTPEGIPRAVESSKSNALMRCCKDLGIAAELWDRRYVRKWKARHAEELWVEHVTLKKKAKIWIKKGDPVEYPFKTVAGFGAAPAKPATTNPTPAPSPPPVAKASSSTPPVTATTPTPAKATTTTPAKATTTTTTTTTTPASPRGYYAKRVAAMAAAKAEAAAAKAEAEKTEAATPGAPTDSAESKEAAGT